MRPHRKNRYLPIPGRSDRLYDGRTGVIVRSGKSAYAVRSAVQSQMDRAFGENNLEGRVSQQSSAEQIASEVRNEWGSSAYQMRAARLKAKLVAEGRPTMESALKDLGYRSRTVLRPTLNRLDDRRGAQYHRRE